MTRTPEERERRRAELLEHGEGRNRGRLTEARRGGASAGRRFAARNAVVRPAGRPGGAKIGRPTCC